MVNKYKEIVKINENTAIYKGYILCRDGSIISPKGKKIRGYAFSYPYSHVTLKINNHEEKKNRAMLIWHAFSTEPVDGHSKILKFRDGNTNNPSFENLYVINRKDEPETFKNTLTNEIKDNIWKDYNGYNYDNQKLSLRKISLKYNCSLMTVQKVIKAGKCSAIL